MRKNIDPGLAIPLLAVVLLTGLYSIARYRHRFVQNRTDLVRRLPAGDATRFFADVSLLRRAGLLKTLSNPGGKSEPDYQQFVTETGFDYSRDLDAVAGSYANERLVLLAQGRFNWRRLRAYASKHSGTCNEQTCALPGSQPGRWISFGELQPDVLVVSVSADRRGVAALLGSAAVSPPPEIPGDPIWLEPAPSLYLNPAALPLPVRIFAIALQSSTEVVVSGTQSHAADDAFMLRLKAHFPISAAADTARAQFEMDTRMLRAELAREHAPANSADLAGLLTAGVFQTVGNDLVAEWPVKQKLLRSLR